MEPKKILFNLVLTTLIIYALARYNIIPGLFIGGVYSALVVASLMGLLNVAIRMFLPAVGVPVYFSTLWITAVILNTGILLFIGNVMDSDQFALNGDYGGLIAAILGGFAISVAQSIIHKLFD